MKKILVFLVSCVTTLSVLAQYYSASTVTITVNGNKNRQVLVDGKNYSATEPVINDNSVITGNPPVSITITDLQTGQHKLELVRVNQNQNNNRNNRTNTKTFNTRAGYDMQIIVNNDGSVQLKEVKQKRNRNANNQYRTPMTDASFTALLKTVQKEWRTSTRTTLVTNAFANTSNYFTTAQAKKLIQQVYSQTSRLELAKSSYRTITDPGNFSQLNDLLTAAAARAELQAYVNTYSSSQGYNNGYGNNGGNNNGYNNPYRTPMSDASFNIIYRDVQRESLQSGKISALTNVFANTNNYFTTSQARQMILLISGESSRLQLAKSSYRSITDPANFSQLNDLLTTWSSKDELQAYVTNYNSNNGGNNSGYNNTYRTPMSDASFNTIYRDVQNEYLPGGKMSALTNAFANTNNYFTTAQARKLILMVSDQSNRLQLGKLSYRSITDPANFSQLYDVFTSQARTNELAAYVSSYNSNPTGNNSFKTPMSDAAHTEILRNVQSQWLPGAKMSALTNFFANTNNYFTSIQAKQLIELVSDENNRLQLAKSSYPNITDPANFNLVSNLLSSQAARNDLAAFVNSYARY
ncbi:MAG: DUF4476 domain-containing protein [Chitinophagales bacterium]